MRRTKATLIYRRTKNLRAVQLLLGHSKLESTVRYLDEGQVFGSQFESLFGPTRPVQSLMTGGFAASVSRCRRRPHSPPPLVAGPAHRRRRRECTARQPLRPHCAPLSRRTAAPVGFHHASRFSVALASLSTALSEPSTKAPHTGANNARAS